MAPALSLWSALRRHWPYYLAEAAGIATFLTAASLGAVLIHHPDFPVRGWLGESELLRRAVLAGLMGLVLAGITYQRWGQRSGAQINPAVTLAFWQLGSLRPADACWYIVAQCAGAVLAGLALSRLLAPWFPHPNVEYNLTLPGPAGWGVALLAEVLITGALMGLLLYALHSERLRPYTGWLVAALLALYIAFETPLSGMSLNPARSLGSAVGAGRYEHLWVYLVAPVAGAWLATALFQRLYHGAPLTCAVLAGCPAPGHGPHAAPQFPDPGGDQR